MISVIAPCLDERKFAKGWLSFVKSISDDIHVADCGSTDGSPKLLKGVNIQSHKIDSPYDWQEGKIRNSLIDACKEEWILKLDMDELFDENFVRELPNIIRSRKWFVRFPHYCFWVSPYTYRVNALSKYTMWRFQSRVHLFRNDPLIRYKETGNHAPLSYNGRSKHLLRFFSDINPNPCYHYHYLVDAKSSKENRYFERRKSGLHLATYFGTHPKQTQLYEFWNQYRTDKVFHRARI